MKSLSLIAASLIIASCASDKTSQNLYSSKDIGRAIHIKACTVVSSRSVIIKTEGAGEKGETLGFFAGNIGARSNSSKPLSGFLGGLVGGAIGRSVSDSLHERDGVEYTVLLATGSERQLVQDLRDDESMLTIGEPCRLQTSGNSNRVLSAKKYPDTVKKPKRVGFAE